MLFDILGNVRKIKKHKAEIAKFALVKGGHEERHQEVREKFKVKQEEVKILNIYYQLSKIRKYNDELKKVELEGSDVDVVRVKGLALVDELKRDLIEVRCHGYFDIIYSSKLAGQSKVVRETMEASRQLEELRRRGRPKRHTTTDTKRSVLLRRVGSLRRRDSEPQDGDRPSPARPSRPKRQSSATNAAPANTIE